MSKPAPSARHVAEVAARDHDPVGHLPAELLRDLDRDRLLALEAQRVHRVREVDALAPRRAPARSPCSRRSRCRARARARPLASGCTSCAVEILPRGRITTARMPGGRGVRGERRRGVAGRRARDRADRRARRAIICLTIETSTVMPRSLNEPECDVPHCLTRSVREPERRAVAPAHERGCVPPSCIDTMCSSRSCGRDPLVLAPHAASRTAASTSRQRSSNSCFHAAALRAAQRRDVVRDLEQLAARAGSDRSPASSG